VLRRRRRHLLVLFPPLQFSGPPGLCLLILWYKIPKVFLSLDRRASSPLSSDYPEFLIFMPWVLGLVFFRFWGFPTAYASIQLGFVSVVIPLLTGFKGPHSSIAL